MSPKTMVVLLGTGTPIPDPERLGPSVAVVAEESAYIVDLGPGVIRRAEAAFRDGITGLEVRLLTKAFLTHLHSDHTTGLSDFILTPWVIGRDEAVSIYGPRGTRAMVEHVRKAYREDIKERLEGLEGTDRKGLKVYTREISPGVVYSDPHVEVEAFPVVHGRWQAFGYKFTTNDRTVVISGDTAPCEKIEEKSFQCDLLVHEVYSDESLEEKNPQWKHYHRRMHTSAHELGDLAARVKPGLLVLYHQLYWGVSDARLLEEVREIYSGTVVSGKDLGVY
jgi:ribonuclease BN (tRNA processing enzyme)